MKCPFCEPDKQNIIMETNMARAVWDQYPVSPGHILIVPKQHIGNYFQLPRDIVIAMWDMVEACKQILDETHRPDGYNIGINCGEAAGQSVPHVHIHIIPRYKGDVENPRGGVRGVIPGKQNY